MSQIVEFPEYVDEFGVIGPIPASQGPRTPPEEGFRFGPEVGEVLPDITLPDWTGATINLHEDRQNTKAAVVFFRSAVW
jgi:hypothetical protein